MKNLIPIIIVIAAVGCIKSPEEKVAGTYSMDEGGVIIMVLREREGIHVVECYTLGEFDGGQEPYKIVGKEVHVQEGKFLLGHDACAVLKLDPTVI